MAVGISMMSAITSCKKSSDDHPDPGPAGSTKEDLLVHNWELDSLVNASDPKTYLYSSLQFFNSRSFTNSSRNGSLIAEGTWNISGDSLILSKNIFSNRDTITYFIKKLSADQLILSERYTLDNKDAILEFYYKIIK